MLVAFLSSENTTVFQIEDLYKPAREIISIKSCNRKSPSQTNVFSKKKQCFIACRNYIGHEEETLKQKLYVDNDDDDDDEISWNNQPREGTVCQ